MSANTISSDQDGCDNDKVTREDDDIQMRGLQVQQALAKGRGSPMFQPSEVSVYNSTMQLCIQVDRLLRDRASWLQPSSFHK